MKSLRIEKIALRKAPGFPSGAFPSLPAFCGGLNLVAGPNGSGKTTLAEALRRTIWDIGKDGFEAEATAAAEDGSHSLSLDGRILVQNGPNGGGLPDLPSGEASWRCFRIVDLLQNAEDGSAFASKVKSELFFGVDLDKAALEAGKKTSPTVPTNAVKACKEARRNLRALCEAQKRGAEDKRRLDELKKEIDSLPDLRRRLALLQKAARLKENLAELGRLQAEEALRPEALRRLTTDSLRLHESHKKNLSDRERELDEARRRLGEVQRALATSAVPPALASDPTASEALRESIARLQASDAAIASSRKAFEQARAEEESLEANYSWLGIDPAQKGLEGKLEALAKFARSAEQARGDLILARRKVESLKEGAPAGSGPQELSRRLEEKKADERALLGALARRGRGPLLYALAGGAALAGMAVSWAARSFLPLAAAAALDAVLILVWDRFSKPDLPRETASRLGAADRPSAEDCFALLEKLRGEMEALGEAARRGEALARAAAALEEEEKKFLDWEAGREEAASALGIDVGSPSFERSCFFNFSSELISWRRASSARAAAEKELEDLKRRRAEEERRLQSCLGEEDGSNLILKAGWMIRALESRAKAEEERDRLLKSVGALSEVEAKARRTLSRFWEEVGLEEGDEATLERLVGEKADYDVLLGRIDRLKAETTPSEDIEGLLGKELESLRDEASALEERIDGIEAGKVGYGELVQKRNDLISSEKLAQAKAAMERAEEELLQKWEENAVALGIGILERTVEEESSKREKPALLSKASAWLAGFTDGQHDIRFRQGRLVSRDHDRGRDYEIGELSSGTRVQLLIALRLASIELQERGTAYPVFFDEVMANSDDARAGKLADAIAKIAQSRQVFYFTAQDDEVQRLLSRCDELGTEREVVDLGSAAARSKPRAHKARPPRQWDFDCPYGLWMERNHVPSGSLFDEVASLPSWFLFFDMEGLRACLDKGLEKIRQVAASASYKDSEEAAIAEALETIRPLALKGRARKVTADVLNDFQPPNKEAAYWKAIVSYVREAKAVDGAALVEEIEAGRRFKRAPVSFIGQLRRDLLESGHLAAGEREDEALILDQLRSRGAGAKTLRAAKRYLEVFSEP